MRTVIAIVTFTLVACATSQPLPRGYYKPGAQPSQLDLVLDECASVFDAQVDECVEIWKSSEGDCSWAPAESSEEQLQTAVVQALDDCMLDRGWLRANFSLKQWERCEDEYQRRAEMLRSAIIASAGLPPDASDSDLENVPLFQQWSQGHETRRAYWEAHYTLGILPKACK